MSANTKDTFENGRVYDKARIYCLERSISSFAGRCTERYILRIKGNPHCVKPPSSNVQFTAEFAVNLIIWRPDAKAAQSWSSFCALFYLLA